VFEMDKHQVEIIRSTEKVVGQIDPVIFSKNGELVQGKHRLAVNPKWKRETRDLTPLQVHAIRLVGNCARRAIDEEDVNDFARFLRKTEPYVPKPEEKGKGKEKYLVKFGLTIAQRISECTGLGDRTFRDLLDNEFKRPYDDLERHSKLGEGTRATVPKQVKQVVEKWAEKIVEAVEADPANKKVVLSAAMEHLQQSTAALDAHAKKTRAAVEEQRLLDAELLNDSADYGSSTERKTVKEREKAEKQQRDEIEAKKEKNGKTEKTPFKLAGIGEVKDVSSVFRPIFKHVGATVACTVCKAPIPLNSKMSFSVPNDDLPKLVSELAAAQTRLTQFG